MFKYFLIIPVLLFIWSFFIEPNLLVIKNYTLDAAGGNKIVFVSDFHIAKNEKKRLKKIVKLINEQKPDLVLSGGDFIKGHDGKNTLSIEEQAEILKQIKAPVITVLGNHDGWYDKERIKNVLEKNGITVLENTNIGKIKVYYNAKELLEIDILNINKINKKRIKNYMSDIFKNYDNYLEGIFEPY